MFSLNHSSFCTHLPFSPVITIPCQFALRSSPDAPFKCQKKSYHNFRKHSTLKKEAAYFTETHTCPTKNVHDVTCQKTSCSRHSAAFLSALSLHNWNCVDRGSLASTQVVLPSDMMVSLLDEFWTLDIQNINQTCCPFDRQIWYQILEGIW